MVEHVLAKHDVAGSSPVSCSSLAVTECGQGNPEAW